MIYILLWNHVCNNNNNNNNDNNDNDNNNNNLYCRLLEYIKKLYVQFRDDERIEKQL